VVVGRIILRMELELGFGARLAWAWWMGDLRPDK
jgi:hypothetical protein